ncbi:MAG TPA: type VI secretion system baseplate subunit TssE [Phycisphaerae bacterium]|nr:type VI secretion system baseplate subunit TssE [Phycisphaerae bacterium]HPM22294.1 type VI secretion system baseplate subunit TssE [Phycisphaerae bacterium]HQL53206.1 type VI secretion system baseplate subunit TssE [Phycisphaerae bacterium]
MPAAARPGGRHAPLRIGTPAKVVEMGREKTLLDRVAASGAERVAGRYDATTAEDLEGRMESVRRHITRLLNSRHGMSEAAPDYGLPALADLMAGSDQYVRLVQDAIRATIEKYEPRLRRVRVSQQTDEAPRHTLVFRIDAVMVGRSGEHRVWYETALAPSGELRVSG